MGEVGGKVAAAEFEEADGLARTVTVGKIVVSSELGGRVPRGRNSGGGFRAIGGRDGIRPALHDAAIICAEDAFDDFDEFGGDVDGADAAAVVAAGVFVVEEFYVKGLLDRGDGAGEMDGAGGETGFGGGEAEFGEDGGDFFDVGGGGAVGGGELIAGHGLFGAGGEGGESLFAAEFQGEFEGLGGVGATDGASAGGAGCGRCRGRRYRVIS